MKCSCFVVLIVAFRFNVVYFDYEFTRSISFHKLPGCYDGIGNGAAFHFDGARGFLRSTMRRRCGYSRFVPSSMVAACHPPCLR